MVCSRCEHSINQSVQIKPNVIVQIHPQRRFVLGFYVASNCQQAAAESSNTPSYLLSVGSNTEVNISKGASTHSLGDTVFLRSKAKQSQVHLEGSGKQSTKVIFAPKIQPKKVESTQSIPTSQTLERTEILLCILDRAIRSLPNRCIQKHTVLVAASK